ncbi:hypothetical protein VNO77_05128 [Canavalia gladiata]|uniref:Uncharacterized protein n=1 Tax=Canavalia gladiata TaxID=3824 RepID=A0AAN9RDW4_CANGL
MGSSDEMFVCVKRVKQEGTDEWDECMPLPGDIIEGIYEQSVDDSCLAVKTSSEFSSQLGKISPQVEFIWIKQDRIWDWWRNCFPGDSHFHIIMSTDKESSSSTTSRKLSCATCFDALWFCYSPVHQMQQYYRLGVLDNCSDKWRALVDCLMLKTKPASQVQEVLETKEKSKSHIWTFRTPEEASYNWKNLYDHLDKPE